MDKHRKMLDDIQAQIAAERQKGAEGNKLLISQLEVEEAGVLLQMDELTNKQQREEVTENNTAQATGIKDTLIAINDAVWQDGIVGTPIGLTEYTVMVQTHNQLTSEAVDEWQAKMNDYVSTLLEQKDEKNRALTSDLFDAQARQKEAERREQETTQRYVEQISGLIEQHAENVNSLNDRHAAEIAALNDQHAKDIQAKDEQITRLEDELKATSKPAEIKLPSDGGPSQTLAEKIAATKTKSAVEIALAGQVFRGKIQVAEPEQRIAVPAFGIGGSESAESFRNESGETPASESADSGVPTTPVAFRGEDTESTVYGMGEGASTETGELVSREEFQALAARVLKLEIEQVGEAAA